MWTETVRAAGVGAARVAFDDRRADGTRLATLFLENRKAVPARAIAAGSRLQPWPLKTRASSLTPV
jgi:hypothetical protein